jgi:hypothetical protein
MKSAAKLYRVGELFDPPQSAFSDAERAAITAETRRLIALGTTASPNQKRAKDDPARRVEYAPEDPVAKWRREADEQTARDLAERDHERVEQRLRQREMRRQNRDASQAWNQHLEQRFKNERDFMVRVLGELTAGFEQKIAALESELRKLKP